MRAHDIKSSAKQALSRKWGDAILTTLIAGLLGVFGSAAKSSGSLTAKISNMDILSWIFDSPAGQVVLIVLGAVGTVMSLWALAHFLLGGALRLGYCTFTLNITDGKPAKVGDLFSRFGMWGQAFLMQLLLDIYTFLWTLLFIIPGIIKSYAYAMTPYILLEHPEMTANEAIDQSIELMRGNKWRLFCLRLSFIGWGILCLFTFGIGYLWLNPFKQVSEAEFYRQIAGEKNFA